MEEKKIYINGSIPINKNKSILNLETNSFDFNTFDIPKEVRPSFDNLLKASNVLYPNKFDVFLVEDKLCFLYEVGDLPFYYSNQNKVHLMKGCYVGFLINHKIGIHITHMVMFRNQFSLKEYFKGMWHQSHASSNASDDFVRTMCFGSNRFPITLNAIFKNKSGENQYASIVANLHYLPDQIQYENPRSPLNGTVSQLNAIPIKGVAKFDTLYSIFDNVNLSRMNTEVQKSIKNSLLKDVKYTYKYGELKWLKFKENLRTQCESLTDTRTYCYEGEDYVRSHRGKEIPKTKFIETYKFRREIRDRIIYNLGNYSDEKSIVKKVLASPQRVPDLIIQSSLDSLMIRLNNSLTVKLVTEKKDTTTHLVRTLDQLKDLKIKKEENVKKSKENKSKEAKAIQKKYEQI